MADLAANYLDQEQNMRSGRDVWQEANATQNCRTNIKMQNVQRMINTCEERQAGVGGAEEEHRGAAKTQAQKEHEVKIINR